MRPVGDYRDTCGACVHFTRDEEREREQAEIWLWMAGSPVHKCDVHGQVVESLDSPNACGSAAEGCTEFELRGRGYVLGRCECGARVVTTGGAR